MKRLLIALLLLTSFSSFGQVAQRVYAQAYMLVIANADGTNPREYRYGETNIDQCGDYICVRVRQIWQNAYTPAQFLNQYGTPYSTVSASAALSAFKTSITGGSSSTGTGGGGTGPQGVPGVDGKTILSGNGPPSSSVGNVGDFYFDKTSTVFYGPKVSGSWSAGVSLIGANGAPGQQGQQGNQGIQGVPGTATNGTNGTNGVDGNTILYGSSNPTPGTGANGNFFINTSTITFFGPKAGGAWPAGISLVGPPGTGGSTTVTNNLTTSATGTALDAAQGKILKDNADGLNTTVTNHANNTTVHITTAERSTWNNKQDALGFTPIATTTFVSYTSTLANDLSNRVTTTAFANYTATTSAAIAGKEPSIVAGTTNQVWRGDKTFGTISASVISDFVAAVRASFPTSGTGYTYDPATGKFTITGGGSGTGSSADTLYFNPAQFVGAGTQASPITLVTGSSGTSTGLTTNWTLATLQAESDSRSAAGGATIIVNNPVSIGTTSYQARSNIKLKSTNKKGGLFGTQDQPCIEAHGVIYNAVFEDLILRNDFTTAAGTGNAVHAGIFNSYNDAEISGLTFRRDTIKVPRANMNAMSIVPYVPSSAPYLGSGTGNMFTGFLVEDCVFDSIGRAPIEAINLTHADNKTDELFNNSTVRRCKFTNSGWRNTDNPKFGAALTWSGLERYATFEDIEITNCWFAALEIVGGKEMSAKNIKANSTSSSYFFSIVSISATDKGDKSQIITLENVGGTAPGRMISAQDTDSLTIKGSQAVTGGRSNFDRVNGLYINDVYWSVNKPEENVDAYGQRNGGSVVAIKDTRFKISRSRFYSTATTGTNYAVIESSSASSGSVDNSIFYRPASNGADNMVKLNSSTSTITQTNVKQTNTKP